MIMKKTFYYLPLLILSVLLFSCSQDSHDDGKVLARINDYSILQDEFQYQLAEEIDLYSDLKLTKEVRRDFLDRLIKKELLIQEAKRLQLDRRDDFIKTIERYWESTLIRDLLEIKGEEISQRILVSQEEIEAYYNDMKKAGMEVSSLAEVETDITKAIKEEKKSRLLKEWIDGLLKNATVEVNQELLYSD
jgi:maltoporin